MVELLCTISVVFTIWITKNTLYFDHIYMYMYTCTVCVYVILFQVDKLHIHIFKLILAIICALS